MAFEEKQGFCKSCDKKVLARKQLPTHILHFFLSLVTFGAWVLVWLFIVLNSQNKPFYCTKCGGKTQGRIANLFSEWNEGGEKEGSELSIKGSDEKNGEENKNRIPKSILISCIMIIVVLAWVVFEILSQN